MFQASIPNKGTQSAVRTRVLDAMSRRKWVILKRTLLANVISGHVMTDVLLFLSFSLQISSVGENLYTTKDLS